MGFSHFSLVIRILMQIDERTRGYHTKADVSTYTSANRIDNNFYLASRLPSHRSLSLW